MTEAVQKDLSTNLFLWRVEKQKNARHKADVKLKYNKRPRLR